MLLLVKTQDRPSFLAIGDGMFKNTTQLVSGVRTTTVLWKPYTALTLIFIVFIPLLRLFFVLSI